MFVGGFELYNLFNNNLFTSIINKLSYAINSNFSYFNGALSYVINMLNYLSKIIVWISSYTGLRYEVILIILGLIGGGIGIVIASFGIKLLVKWWSVLVP